MKIASPQTYDASKYYTRYLSLAKGEDLLVGLENISRKTINTISKLKDEDLAFRYEEGKWSIGVLLQHICDAERVFAYRALRFLRNDFTELAGFSEDDFANNSKGYDNITDFVREYHAVRSSSVHVFLNSNLDSIDEKGIASGIEFNAREIGWLMIGHNIHHLNVLEERYLAKLKK